MAFPNRHVAFSDNGETMPNSPPSAAVRMDSSPGGVRALRRLRLGLLLFWRGKTLTVRSASAPDLGPDVQRRRWEEVTLASEQFHSATAALPSGGATNPPNHRPGPNSGVAPFVERESSS
jgi:hypothetical protein